ncbi:MAG: alpha/beta hydrolase [Solobacterium sp.]|nr:alpha/beta hydrolase [Solobacterium sp.]
MIDYKETVVLNGLPQRIHVKGQKASNPVLLFLHGGPGVTNRHSVIEANSDLCDAFTIVAWDQRGTCGSYEGCKAEDLTVSQLTEDAAELVKYLCETFDQEKVFIIGGSWGSCLGTLLAKRHPEHIAAYVGFGQFVDGPANEKLSYQFALDEARRHNDKKSVEKLVRIGYPVDGVYPHVYEDMMTQRKIMMKYGGYSQDKKKRSYLSATILPVLRSKEYTAKEITDYVRGYQFVLKNMWKEVAGLNMLKETEGVVEVPYFIFDGRLDNNTPASLVQDYYDQLQAPEKDLIWFDQAGHNPLGDCPEAFKKCLREKLLPIAEREGL